MLAPWDERAWENFRDAYPEAASYLLDLVNAEGTNKEIRDYCETEGYSRRVADWLVHAAEHLRRSMRQGQAPEPAGSIDPPSPPAGDARAAKIFIEEGVDGTRDWTTRAKIVTAQFDGSERR